MLKAIIRNNTVILESRICIPEEMKKKLTDNEDVVKCLCNDIHTDHWMECSNNGCDSVLAIEIKNSYNPIEEERNLEKNHNMLLTTIAEYVSKDVKEIPQEESSEDEDDSDGILFFIPVFGIKI